MTERMARLMLIASHGLKENPHGEGGHIKMCQSHPQPMLPERNGDIAVRQIYLGLAHQWRELAEQADQPARMQSRNR
jgi:hypothetical protein